MTKAIRTAPKTGCRHLAQAEAREDAYIEWVRPQGFVGWSDPLRQSHDRALYHRRGQVREDPT